MWLGGVKYRLGTGYRWYSFLFNIKHYQHRKETKKHELEYNLDLLKELNCNNIKQLIPFIEIKDNAIDVVERKLKTLGVDVSNFLIIHIPSLGSAKVWSDENFIKLLNLLRGEDRIDSDIILTGTQNDKPKVEKIRSIVKNDRIFTIFDLNLKELAALLKLSGLFIGNSTGPIHIAAAVGTFCIGFYSPVKVETAVRWGPYTEKRKIFQPEKDDSARDVMDDIKPDEVFNFVKQYLNNKI